MKTHKTDRRKVFIRGFERSKKGNLWRYFKGMTLSVFSRKDAWFAWSIADTNGPRYSLEAYPTERLALYALMRELEHDDNDN